MEGLFQFICLPPSVVQHIYKYVFYHFFLHISCICLFLLFFFASYPFTAILIQGLAYLLVGSRCHHDLRDWVMIVWYQSLSSLVLLIQEQVSNNAPQISAIMFISNFWEAIGYSQANFTFLVHFQALNIYQFLYYYLFFYIINDQDLRDDDHGLGP